MGRLGYGVPALGRHGHGGTLLEEKDVVAKFSLDLAIPKYYPDAWGSGSSMWERLTEYLEGIASSIVFGMGERDEGVPVLLVHHGDSEIGARKPGFRTEPPSQDDR